MAMIVCPECGKEISDAADSCPHCGFPLRKPENKKPIPTKLIIALLAAVIIVCGIAVAVIMTVRLTDDEQRSVNKVISAINDIGNVTTKSESKIADAEAAYDELSNKCKRHVENHEKLIEARATYNELMAADTDKLIEAIGTVDDDSEKKIVKAKESYDALTDDQKKLVKNHETLDKAATEYNTRKASAVDDLVTAIGEIDDDAEERINKAKEAYEALNEEQKKLVKDAGKIDKAYEDLSTFKVKRVEEKISAIGKVSLESEAAIKDAKSEYEKLTDDDKTKVSNADVITEAEKQYDEIAIAECEKLIDEIGDVSIDSKDKISAAKKLYGSLSSDQKNKVSNSAKLTDADVKYQQLAKEKDIRDKTMAEGDKFSSNKWEVTLSSVKITDKLLPNKTSGYYTYYYANDDETFIDLKFQIKNIDVGMLGLESLVSNCKVEYKNQELTKAYGLYYSYGTQIDKVYSWDGIDALDSCTLHVAIGMPREIVKNDEWIRVKINIAGYDKYINVRGYDSSGDGSGGADSAMGIAIRKCA